MYKEIIASSKYKEIIASSKYKVFIASNMYKSAKSNQSERIEKGFGMICFIHFTKITETIFKIGFLSLPIFSSGKVYQ